MHRDREIEIETEIGIVRSGITFWNLRITIVIHYISHAKKMKKAN